MGCSKKCVSCKSYHYQRHRKAQPITTFQGPVMLNFKSHRIVWGSGEEKQKVPSSREEDDVVLG